MGSYFDAARSLGTYAVPGEGRIGCPSRSKAADANRERGERFSNTDSFRQWEVLRPRLRFTLRIYTRTTPGIRSLRNLSRFVVNSLVLALFTNGFDAAAETTGRTCVVDNRATNASDDNPGTDASPLKTIQAAADKAQPGDTVLVKAGIYREKVVPPRGGESADKPIVYKAAEGHAVSIRGSEANRNGRAGNLLPVGWHMGTDRRAGVDPH
jgi:hypothetical protein